MPQQATVPAVNQRVLAQGLEQLRTAADEDTVRINPVRFAEQHGVPTEVVVELFLHARKFGLVTMEWQYFFRARRDRRAPGLADVRDVPFLLPGLHNRCGRKSRASTRTRAAI